MTRVVNNHDKNVLVGMDRATGEINTAISSDSVEDLRQTFCGIVKENPYLSYKRTWVIMRNDLEHPYPGLMYVFPVGWRKVEEE